MRVSKTAALIAVLALVLAACAGSTAETTTTAEAPQSTEGTAAPATTEAPEATTTTAAEVSAATEMTIGLQLEPPTLDLTASPAAAIPQVLLYNVYEGLVRLNADGSISGLLASDWEISEDGLTYTFTLQQGVAFHNGEALTADDVVFSINNVVNNEAHPFTTTLAPITNVEATDDSTVVLTLSQVSANLLFFLTQGQGVILEESAIGTIENEPVGTGPFTFTSWTVGDSIVVERNADYWGTPALLEKVTFRYINDPSALTNAMLSDDLDILAGVSAPETLAEFEADDRFEVRQGLTYGETVLSLNGRRAPLDDVLVRQAISHAIDRDAVVQLAYSGYGTVIGSFSTPLDAWYKDLTGVYEYDPAKAQDLLEEAGYAGETLEMILPPTSYATRSGEIIASQLAEVGIDVNITNVEWGVWLEDVFTNNDFDMSIVSHVEPFDLAQYGNADYYWGDDSPQVADLIAQADAEPDEAKRNALYGQVLDEITAVAADNWLFVLPALGVQRKGVSGYKIDLPGSLDLTELALNE
ncbi:MAG: ABC transporter substrate-binding protein [Actinomycetota bacterium]|nr:ABC transporter substrate-binding protein [Actinomycetota bacterium]